MCNIVFVLGVHHNDLIHVYIAKCLPHFSPLWNTIFLLVMTSFAPFPGPSPFLSFNQSMPVMMEQPECQLYAGFLFSPRGLLPGPHAN